MNHVALAVESEERLKKYRERLRSKGLWASKPVFHADNASGVAQSGDDPLVAHKSVYFFGPDGEFLELCCCPRQFGGKRDLLYLPAGPCKLLDGKYDGKVGGKVMEVADQSPKSKPFR